MKRTRKVKRHRFIKKQKLFSFELIGEKKKRKHFYKSLNDWKNWKTKEPRNRSKREEQNIDLFLKLLKFFEK